MTRRLHKVWWKKTGQDMKLKMARSVHEVAKYTKIHIRYNILISQKM